MLLHHCKIVWCFAWFRSHFVFHLYFLESAMVSTVSLWTSFNFVPMHEVLVFADRTLLQVNDASKTVTVTKWLKYKCYLSQSLFGSHSQAHSFPLLEVSYCLYSGIQVISGKDESSWTTNPNLKLSKTQFTICHIKVFVWMCAHRYGTWKSQKVVSSNKAKIWNDQGTEGKQCHCSMQPASQKQK